MSFSIRLFVPFFVPRFYALYDAAPRYRAIYRCLRLSVSRFSFLVRYGQQSSFLPPSSITHITYPKHIHFPSSHGRPQPLPTSPIPIPSPHYYHYPFICTLHTCSSICSHLILVHDHRSRPLVTIDAPHRHDSHIFQSLSFSLHLNNT